MLKPEGGRSNVLTVQLSILQEKEKEEGEAEEGEGGSECCLLAGSSL